jgi:hypothetical protein
MLLLIQLMQMQQIIPFQKKYEAQNLQVFLEI